MGTFQYTVKPGDDPQTIAQKFNLTTEHLLEVNRGAYPFSLGQGIKIPKPGMMPGYPPSSVTQPFQFNAPKAPQPTTVSTNQIGPAFGRRVGQATTAPSIGEIGQALSDWWQGLVNYKPPQAATSVTKPASVYPSNMPRAEQTRQETVKAAFPASTPMESPFDQPKNTVMVDYGEGRTLEQPVMLTPNDLGALAQKAGMNFYDYAKQTGYIKVGNAWVFNGSMVNGALTPNVQGQNQGQNKEPWYAEYGVTQNKPGSKGNRSGKNFRNAHGSLVRWNNRQQRFVTGTTQGRQAQQQAAPESQTANRSQMINQNASTG